MRKLVGSILLMLILSFACVAQVQKAIVTLTDSQIKALPTTPVELIASPGANKFILPISATVYFHWTANYTNIDSNAALNISHANGYSLLTALFENDGSSSISNLLNDDDDYMAIFTQKAETTSGRNIAYYIWPGGLVNKNLTIGLYNGFSGTLTGGDANNSITVTVLYTVNDVS